MNSFYHSYQTRSRHNLAIPSSHIKSITHVIARLINSLPCDIRDKIPTHSLRNIAERYKNYIISAYLITCNTEQCYVCSRTLQCISFHILFFRHFFFSFPLLILGGLLYSMHGNMGFLIIKIPIFSQHLVCIFRFSSRQFFFFCFWKGQMWKAAFLYANMSTPALFLLYIYELVIVNNVIFWPNESIYLSIYL